MVLGVSVGLTQASRSAARRAGAGSRLLHVVCPPPASYPQSTGARSLSPKASPRVSRTQGLGSRHALPWVKAAVTVQRPWTWRAGEGLWPLSCSVGTACTGAEAHEGAPNQGWVELGESRLPEQGKVPGSRSWAPPLFSHLLIRSTGTSVPV